MGSPPGRWHGGFHLRVRVTLRLARPWVFRHRQPENAQGIPMWRASAARMLQNGAAAPGVGEHPVEAAQA
jgi:hypothetical protein